jgi:hypothetical protein
LKYITINEHAFNLFRILNFIEFQEISHDNFDNISDWLNMAAGVERVNIITERYDSSIYMCGSALDFSKEKSKLWSDLCSELVTFNFLWGSFEALTLKFINTNHGDDSTTFLARKFINSNYKGPTINGYIDTFNELYRIFGRELQNHLLSIIGREPHPTKGLLLVSKLRNQFAHGLRLLPLPDDWSDELSREVDNINLSSRIILFTIQMLLLAKFGYKGYIIEDPMIFDFVELEGPVHLDDLIKNLHFENLSERI